MRHSTRLAACIIATALLAPAGSEAQQMRQPVAIGSESAEVIDAALRVSRTIELPPVSMAEILGLGLTSRFATSAATGGTAVALGTWSPGAASAPARTPEPHLLLRNVPDVWLIRQSSDQRKNQYLDVGYAIHSLKGGSGRLSHPEDAGSQISVRLEAITPTLVGADGEYDLLQGGVTFYLDLAGIRRAGQHLGLLTVTFNNL